MKKADLEKINELFEDDHCKCLWEKFRSEVLHTDFNESLLRLCFAAGWFMSKNKGIEK